MTSVALFFSAGISCLLFRKTDNRKASWRSSATDSEQPSKSWRVLKVMFLSPFFQPLLLFSFMRQLVLANIKNTIILFVCPSKCLNKYCFYFLLGNWKQYISKILEEQTKSIMVFFILANST